MLIGLAGAAGSGKDTAASRLRDGHGFSSLALADPLYAMISIMTGLGPDRLADRKIKEANIDWLGVSPRKLLQTLGTEWARETIGEDVWINHLFRRIDKAGGGDFVVTDVRFQNEAEAIKSRGGYICEIVRPEPLAGISGITRSHSSEAGIPDWLVDVTIVNDTDVRGLLGRVDAALDWLRSDIIHCDKPTPSSSGADDYRRTQGGAR